MGAFKVQDVIDGIKEGTPTTPPLQRQPVYMKHVYASLITRHYEDMGYDCRIRVDVLIHTGITSFKKNPLLKNTNDVRPAS